MDEERYTPSVPRDGGDVASRAAPDVSEAELARQFWDRLRLFAARRLGDAAAAEDVAQETLRRVVEALRAGRVENRAALPGFVFQTARHICLQQRRSAGREARAMLRLHEGEGEAAISDDPLAALIGEERRAEVRRALDRLAASDRELLRLLYYERLDVAHIAERLAVTPAALRVRKHRALQRLAELLAGDAA